MSEITLDEKDIVIVNALYRYGPNFPLSRLCKELNIPERTLRYRIKNLRDRGYLNSYPIIHERKLGLGDCIFIVQEVNNQLSLHELLEEIPYIYLISSTYGKNNGILCYAIYSLDSPRWVDSFLETLKRENFINNYYIFSITDQKVTQADLTLYNISTDDWNWDWDLWIKNLETTIANSDFDKNFHFDEQPTVIKFDEKDLALLRVIKETYHFQETPKKHIDIAQELKISDTQVRRRLRRLESERVIKEYLVNFTTPYYYNTLFFYLFLNFKKPADASKVLSAYSALPFQVTIFYESNKKYCLFFQTSAKDLAGILRSFEVTKHFCSSYFFQLLPFYFNSRHHLFQGYDETKKKWVTSIDQFESLINKYKL